MSKKEEEPEHYTKYERARMLGARALQISMGAPFLVKLSEEDLKRLRYSPVEIAKLEFEAGAIPLTVKRPMPVPRSIMEEAEKLQKPQEK